MEKLHHLRAIAAAFASTRNQPQNHQDNEKNEDTGQPNWAQDHDLLISIFLIEKRNFLSGTKNTKLRRALPSQGVATRGLGKDNRRGAAGGLAVCSDGFRLKNNLVGEKIPNFQRMCHAEVDIAVIFDRSGGRKR